MNYIDLLILFVSLFIAFFLVTYLNNKRKLKKRKKSKFIELDYLVSKFKLDTKKINKKKVSLGIALINSFILSLVCNIVFILPLKLIWGLLIAFPLLLGLIYSLYEIYGRHLKRLENKYKT